MGSFRTKTIDDEFDVCSWYTTQTSAIARLSGCIAARQCFVPQDGPNSQFYMSLLWKIEENFEEKHEAMGLTDDKWTQDSLNYTVHAPGSPSVAERLWLPVSQLGVQVNV